MEKPVASRSVGLHTFRCAAAGYDWNNINDLWAITLVRMKNRADSSVKKIPSTCSSPAYLSRFTAHLLTCLYHSFPPRYLLPSLSFQFTSPLLFISPSSFLSHLWDFLLFRFCFLRIGRRKLISFSCWRPNRFFWHTCNSNLHEWTEGSRVSRAAERSVPHWGWI